MATLEVTEESLVGLYNKHRDNHNNMWDIGQFVKSLGLSSGHEQTSLAFGKQQVIAANNKTQGNCLFTALAPTSIKQLGKPAEVMALTLKVLLHLKASKNEFLNLENIPVLQTQNWNLNGELTEYLLKKNFVKVKGIDSKVYVQITQFGLQYLHACEATAC